MAVGRISGPLLKANLLRDGVDLAFETDLLYLDVNNQRIGIKTNTPSHELQVNGTTRTKDLIVDNIATIGDVTISGNTIETNGTLNLVTVGADTVVYQNKLEVNDISIEGNVISTNNSNANLEIRPNGTGTVEVLSDMNVDGNIHATGNITADGSITLGDATTDNVVFNADVDSNIIPNIDNTYQLGTETQTWKDVWTENFYANQVDTVNLNVDGIDLGLRAGNSFYVATNGNDSNTGTHQQDPVRTIKYALSLASSGDSIHIYPGTYVEVFPLTVPDGVTVTGNNIRSVNITPTTETRYNDAFLLNGQSTIENLTISGFNSGGNFFEVTQIVDTTNIKVNVGTAPFAHTYVSGGTIDSDDSTIANVSNAVYDHTTGDLTITTDVPHDTYLGARLFLKGLIFSCNGGNRTFPDNGYAFRFATDFEVTSRSPYIKNISVITQGTATTVEDPRGFNAGDAGKGAYIDGAYATAASKEASMLFHSATFICPGVDAITATNGVRVEWLNSFTYFANRSFYCFDSNDGKYGDGKTKIRLGNITGTFTPGNTITFTSTDASTTATATIDSVDGDIISVDGRFADLIGFDTTPQSITDGTATATEILNYDLREFGAEVRMIGSASVYGNYGLYGDGPGVIIYAIGHNLAYIGNGKETTNDPGTVIQDNEVIELNEAKIRYNSVDHEGDFRVGDLFFVDQQTGSVDFNVTNFTINTSEGVTFTDGSNTTFVDGTKIETGDWRFSGNTIETLSLTANFDAASGQINLNDNVNITGNLDVTGNVTIGGNITIGDDAGDTIQFVAGIDSDIVPSQTTAYDLGTTAKKWRNLYIRQTNIDDIEITNNYITTVTSNADLELRANGTGKIYIPSNNVQIDNNLTVSGDTDLQSTTITGTITHVGDTTQTGNFNIAGTISNGDIEIAGNVITTTQSNSDLDLRANGTGEILIPNNNVQIDNNLTVSSTTDLQDTNITGTITHVGDVVQTGDADITGNVTITQDLDVTGSAQFEEILIDDNFITTTTSNADLELRASGTGKILIPNNNVEVTGNVNVTGQISAANITSTGTITADSFSSGDILVDDNFITTTLSNSNLELRANGTGEIYIPSNNVQIDNNLTVSGVTSLQNTNITGTVTHVGDTTQTGNFNIAGEISNGNILIEDNFIATTTSNSDLELRASGTGEILVPNNNVQINNDLTVSGDTDLQSTTITGTITHVGDLNQTGNSTVTGNVTVTQDLDVSGSAQFEEILVDDNFITTTTSNANLELRANGTGEVIVPLADVTITNDLTVSGTISTGDINSVGTITANSFSTGDILIDDNFVQTTTSNSNLELRASGTGEIYIPSNNVQIDNNLSVSGVTNLQGTNITGTITHVGDTTQTGNLTVSGNITVTGDLDVSGAFQFEEILIDDNYITTTSTNADLELRANGTGQIVIPNNNVVIDNGLTVLGVLTVGNVVSTGTIQANNFTTGDILIDDNFITTTTSNSNLELRANGTGSIVIDELSFNTTTISSISSITLEPGNEQVILDGTGSLQLPVGTTLERPTEVAGQIRFNSDLARFEGYNGTHWVNLKGVEDVDGNTKITAELTEGANDNTIRFYADGSIVASIDQTGLTTGRLVVDDITLDGNVISSTVDTNLQLLANGTGQVVLENFGFKNNTITNQVVGSNIEIVANYDAGSGTGYVEFADPYGVVLPVGGNATRPTGVQGMIRYNTDDSRVELYDGTSWVSVAGASGGISFADAENIAIEKVLIFG